MDRMNFSEFNETEVFVDTNIFVYALSKKHNLLYSDAIHAASCEVYGIKHIASNDIDFERVDFLKRWKP